jgi:hypothetical protein
VWESLLLLMFSGEAVVVVVVEVLRIPKIQEARNIHTTGAMCHAM